MNPQELSYTTEHEWVRQDDNVVRFGITHFAQDALGDIVFVDLPEVGDALTAGQPCGEVESTKSVSDIYAPVTGKVVARNDELLDTPESINADPYGAGWLLDVEVQGEAMAMLDAAGYEAHLAQL
ncbi:MAG: glycine cleavage system protein GcvH [Actinomycetia bacterium]|nr:glycine cleavage system protein GcvH [Actinomycetes bacterium]MCH9800719.1 glycine cleavage system protein GcvH [Actinomycetes bacterium]